MYYQHRSWVWKPSSRPSFKDRMCLRLNYRWRVLLILVAFSYFLLRLIPAPPVTQNNTRADRPPPEHDVETSPRFIYHSPFREDPDVDYESKLSEALERLEHNALLGDDADYGTTERIWQIVLQKGSTTTGRNPYSILFQEYNSEWAHTLVTSDWATKFITVTLSKIPDLLQLYTSYPHDVLRADLLRYLLLWYYGGYYADTDVFPARTIRSCPSLEPRFRPISSSSGSDGYVRPNVSLVLGIEIDEPYASPKLMREWHWSRSYGFIQYNMYAPRRFSPFLRRAIVRVLAHTRRHSATGNFFRRPQYDERTTLEVTGPGVFTDAILDVLSETLPPTHSLIESSVKADAGIGDLISESDGTQRRVTWAPFHRLKAPLWLDASEAAPGTNIGGLSVLPISVWGNGQRHSGSEGFDSPHACINHQFGRSWKKGWWEYLFG